VILVFRHGIGNGVFSFQRVSDRGLGAAVPVLGSVQNALNTCEKRRCFGSLSGVLARKRSPPGTSGLAVRPPPAPGCDTPSIRRTDGFDHPAGLGQPALGVCWGCGLVETAPREVVASTPPGGHDLGIGSSRLIAADPLRQCRHAFPASVGSRSTASSVTQRSSMRRRWSGLARSRPGSGSRSRRPRQPLLIGRRCDERGGGAVVVFTRAREPRSCG